MSKKLYCIPFVNVCDDTTSEPSAWNYVSQDDAAATGAAQLFMYDNESAAEPGSLGEYYYRILDGVIENNINTSNTLKHVMKTNEKVNLSRFHTDRIVVEVHPELTKYYTLLYMILHNENNGSTSSTDFSERFIPDMVEENRYVFNIGKLVQIDDINKSFQFGFAYNGRREDLAGQAHTYDVQFNVRDTILINVFVEGRTLSNPTLVLANDADIDVREYKRKIYIHDTDASPETFAEFNFVSVRRYDYSLGSGSSPTSYTQFTYQIVNGEIYHATIDGTNSAQDTTPSVPYIKLNAGRAVILRNNTNGSSRIVYWVNEVDEDSRSFIPDNLSLLTIVQAP